MNQSWQKKTGAFIAGQTMTLFGSSLVQYAISWHITLTTKSGMMLTIAILCGFLPQVLISLFAGVWADRFDRKKMIVLADGGIALATLALAILFAVGYDHMWLLFVISVIRSLGQGIQMPAVNAILPDIAPQDKLMRVNGINAGIQSAMMLLAPVAAGALYDSMQLRAIFWVDVVTAAIGISMLLALNIERRDPAPEGTQHVFKEMLGGLRYVGKTQWLRQFLGVYMIYCLMIAPVFFLTPLMVARSFGDEPWRLVVHEIVFAAGMTAGGVTASVFADKFKNKIILVVTACAAFGVATFVMGFSPGFVFYLGTMLLAGLAMPFVNTGGMTVLQTKVQPDFMGRVFGLVMIAQSGVMPLSMAIFGPIADAVRVETLLVITGAAMVAISMCSFRLKAMVAAGKSVEIEEGDPQAAL